MLLWTALAVMTGLAALAVLWPLTRHAASAASPVEAADLAIYKDQLAEIERDRERGLIAAAEADAARTEVSRRLLAADASARALAPKPASLARRRAAAVAILLVIPLVTLGVYLRVGSPKTPDQPLAARLAMAPEDAPLEALVALVETRLSAAPDDAKGWAILAPIYRRQGRLAEAHQAYANVLRLDGSTPDREADLGETIVLGAGGVVTADARAAFERAVARDARHARSLYYLGRATEQDGDKAGAVARWRAVLAAQPADGAVAGFLKTEIARVSGTPAQAGEPAARGPSAADVAAAESMTPQQRAEMIRGMVAGLATRLKSEGGGVDDWLKLVRAYSVLGERGKAMEAAIDARKALASSPDGVRAVDELVRTLGLEG